MSAASNSIQFYGIDQVVDAYKNRQVPAFSICAGKVLQFTYDGTDEFSEYRKPTIQEGIQVLLNYLSSMYSGTTAIYTLKVYDDLKEAQKIRPSTEYSTAFNFRLNEPGMMGSGMIPYQRGGYGQQNMILEELQKLRQEIEELKEEKEEDDEPETLEETIAGILKDPAKLNQHVNTWKNLLGVNTPQSHETVGNVVPFKKMSESENTTITETEEQRWQRLANAIDTLATYDKNIVEHFETLAKMAKEKPEKFQGLISMIDLYA